MSKTTPIDFHWDKPASTVQISGDWNDWSTKEDLSKTADGKFHVEFHLPENSKVHFKFIVDGAWVTDPEFPTEADASGNVNNVVNVGPAPASAAPAAAAAETDGQEPKSYESLNAIAQDVSPQAAGSEAVSDSAKQAQDALPGGSITTSSAPAPSDSAASPQSSESTQGISAAVGSVASAAVGAVVGTAAAAGAATFGKSPVDAKKEVVNNTTASPEVSSSPAVPAAATAEPPSGIEKGTTAQGSEAVSGVPAPMVSNVPSEPVAAPTASSSKADPNSADVPAPLVSNATSGPAAETTTAQQTGGAIAAGGIGAAAVGAFAAAKEKEAAARAPASTPAAVAPASSAPPPVAKDAKAPSAAAAAPTTESSAPSADKSTPSSVPDRGSSAAASSKPKSSSQTNGDGSAASKTKATATATAPAPSTPSKPSGTSQTLRAPSSSASHKKRHSVFGTLGVGSRNRLADSSLSSDADADASGDVSVGDASISQQSQHAGSTPSRQRKHSIFSKIKSAFSSPGK